MYRVRYLEQTDKMSERVRLRMIEEVYSRELLHACVQHSPKRQQKQRRLQHFTGLSVVSWVSADGARWQPVQCGRYQSQRPGLWTQLQPVRQGRLSASTSGDADRMWQSCHHRAAPGRL